MVFRNQKLKERYYDRIRRKVCVMCENKILFTTRLCVNCHEKDVRYNKNFKEKHGYKKLFHSNKLAEKYNTLGIVKPKDESYISDEI